MKGLYISPTRNIFETNSLLQKTQSKIEIQISAKCFGTIRTSQTTLSQLQQDTKCKYKCDIEARSRNHCCCRKAISITYSECVAAALVIQIARNMCRIILLSVTCLAVPYLPTLSHQQQQDYQKKKSYLT